MEISNRTMRRGIITIVAVSIILGITFLVLRYQDMNLENDIPEEFSEQYPSIERIEKIHTSYLADFTDDRVLVGASHNIFVGKVLRKLGNEREGKIPQTQFEVEVVYGIKGNLDDHVTVVQEGGIYDGVLYVIEGDTLEGDRSPAGHALKYMLVPGNTYLLTTRYNPEQEWHIVNPHPNGRALISDQSMLSEGEILLLAKKNKRVRELVTAYPNEVPLDADVHNDMLLNGFDSLSPEQKQEFFDRSDRLESEQW